MIPPARLPFLSQGMHVSPILYSVGSRAFSHLLVAFLRRSLDPRCLFPRPHPSLRFGFFCQTPPICEERAPLDRVVFSRLFPVLSRPAGLPSLLTRLFEAPVQYRAVPCGSPAFFSRWSRRASKFFSGARLSLEQAVF